MDALGMLLTRIREEYREMPDLRLTFAQVCWTWQLDPMTGEVVIERLLTENFLTRDGDGLVLSATNRAHVT